MVLAEAEICGIPVVLICVGLWIWYVCQKDAAKSYTNVSWSGQLFVPGDIPELQEMARGFFVSFENASYLDEQRKSKTFVVETDSLRNFQTKEKSVGMKCP